jgi:hypothetical protein
MLQATNPGPGVRFIAHRGGVALQWKVDFDGKSTLGALADRLEDQLRDEVVFNCEIHALDAQGELVAKLRYDMSEERTAQIMPQASTMISARVEDTVEYALRSSRSFAGLGFKAVIESYEIFKSMMTRLEKENTALRAENAELRQRISAVWELENRLQTTQVDKALEADRAMRLHRVAETFASSLMSRHLGRNTPEGRASIGNVAVSLLRSIAPEQAAKIWPLLSEEQQHHLAILMQEDAENPAEEGPKTSHDAATAAAIANGQGARG